MAKDSLPTVRPEVRELRETLVATRRDFHEHPELSWDAAVWQIVQDHEESAS